MSFSVLMAVYHGDDPDKFEGALESIFSNTLLPDQVILVIDGPIPESLDSIVNNYVAGHSIIVLRIKKNRGLANALNYGLQHIKSEYVFRVDSDDYNVKDRFYKQMQFLSKNKHVDVLGGQIEEYLSGEIFGVRAVPITHIDIRNRIGYRNPINHMTVAFKLEMFSKFGGYPEIKFREDYAYWALLMASGAIFSNLSDVLVHASVNEGFFTRRRGLTYLLDEYRLQKFLNKLGLKSLPDVVTHLLLKFIVYSLPLNSHKYIYKYLLRRHKNERK